MSFCHITTMIQGEKHGNLLLEKGGRGFPRFVFMDSEGQVLADQAGEWTVAGFAATGERISKFITLREKASKGDAVAQADLLVQELILGLLKTEEAETRAATLKFTPVQQKALDEALTNTRVLEISSGAKTAADARNAGKTYFEMHKAGKPAPTHDDAIQAYWILMMAYAEEAKLVDVFEAALTALKVKFGSVPEAADFFKKQDAALERLRGAKPEKK